uniref:phenylalanine--tRNA ligase n=1 Tax=Polysiphonia infestans TaxID=2006978 RepID=A0A1Z1MF51_9FLOR|nr:Phenylalanine-tRNA ligase beta subunit [Polysiphonia infestans]ARW64455.1 Phenylalanine-tRNA ligase beta subunit [Polysiphonia infestans]
MKFSWQLTNSFLKIPERCFKKTLKQLILSGIEIDNIDNITNDKVLDLSITANRKEINSALSLAREISIITNQKIKIKNVPFYNRKQNTGIKNFTYIRIHTIDKSRENKTPEWILKNLKIHDICKRNGLENVQKYISVKWGATFKIIRLDNVKKLVKEDNLDYESNLIQIIKKEHCAINNNNNIDLIIFTTKKVLENYDSYDTSEFYENYYIDSINIIKDSIKCTIGRYYEAYSEFIPENNKIVLERKILNNWLGSNHKTKNKFLRIQQIEDILKKLKFSPKYIKNKKFFTVNIPTYRKHDVKNKIDIIEEVGKIHEFKNFHNKYKYVNKQGKKSRRLVKVNKIRQILRALGLNEVINCSLTNNLLENKQKIRIHNPINEEQTNLRNSIITNLINNYIHHIKYGNENLLIFEIGKTFQKDSEKNKYKEQRCLGGLINAPEYNRNNWVEKPTSINIFQVKGMVELLLEKINAKINFEEIVYDKIENSKSYVIKKNSTICIRDEKTKEIIGMIGEVNNQLISLNQNKNGKVYVFEIELDKLIHAKNMEKHLNYNKKSYSDYPSVVRDISISLNNYECVERLRKKIKAIDEKLIESVKIFNEYKKISTQTNQVNRVVGIRITYRSFNKTLNTKDIKNIDKNLNKTLGNIT